MLLPTLPRQTDESRRLRILRHGLSMHVAADLCGLTLGEYVRLEQGALVPADWARLFALLGGPIAQVA